MRDALSGLGSVVRVALAVVLVSSTVAPALAAGAAAAPTDVGSSTPADSDDNPWPWTDGNESDSENSTEKLGPPQTEFNATLLRQQGRVVSDRPSVRKAGEGMMWIRHVPTGPLITDDPANHSRYIVPGRTTVTRDHVYVGGFLGWNAPDMDVTLHVVTWKPKYVTFREKVGPNTTRTRSKEVPANVSHSKVDLTFTGGQFFRHQVELPVTPGERRNVAIWVDGARWETQVAFDVKVNPATQTVPQSSIGARIMWATWNIGGWTLIGGFVVLVLGKKALDKMGAVIVHPAELIFGVGVPASVMMLVFYNSILENLANRPGMIGIGIGTILGTGALWITREKPEKWLLLHPRADEAEFDRNGRGKWRWANRTHHVIERNRDGRLAVLRKGWIAAFARLYPLYDATPLLEFQAFDLDDRTLDELPDDIEIPDDPTFLDRLKTRFVGDTSEDAFNEILMVDPASEDVIDYSGETLTFGLPTLASWPDDKRLPRIRFGLIVFGLASIVGAVAIVQYATTSPILALGAGIATTMMLITHPAEDTKAQIRLAPAQFDEVLGNMIATLEGLSDDLKEKSWQNRALTAEAKRRTERAERREDQDLTKLRELADRFAPPAEDERRDADTEERDDDLDDTANEMQGTRGSVMGDGGTRRGGQRGDRDE